MPNPSRSNPSRSSPSRSSPSRNSGGRTRRAPASPGEVGPPSGSRGGEREPEVPRARRPIEPAGQPASRERARTSPRSNASVPPTANRGPADRERPAERETRTIPPHGEPAERPRGWRWNPSTSRGERERERERKAHDRAGEPGYVPRRERSRGPESPVPTGPEASTASRLGLDLRTSAPRARPEGDIEAEPGEAGLDEATGLDHGGKLGRLLAVAVKPPPGKRSGRESGAPAGACSRRRAGRRRRATSTRTLTRISNRSRLLLPASPSLCSPEAPRR